MTARKKIEQSKAEKEIIKKIHVWSYTDAQKSPVKLKKLFNEIWDYHIKRKERF